MPGHEEYFRARNEALEKLVSEVNEQQFGGEHYKLQKFQHWDFVIANHLGYFEGQVTKYICRWREKNGVQDLQKALHYLAKLISGIRSGTIPTPKSRGEVSNLHDFCEQYKLSITEGGIARILSIYTSENELYLAGEMIQGLIETFRKQPWS